MRLVKILAKTKEQFKLRFRALKILQFRCLLVKFTGSRYD